MIVPKKFALTCMKWTSICFMIYLLSEGIRILSLTQIQIEGISDYDYCKDLTLYILLAVSIAAIINSDDVIQIGIA